MSTDAQPRRGNVRKRARGKPPGNPPHNSANRNYCLFAEENFGASGYAGRSLLRSVAGAVRCARPNGNSLLFQLIRNSQGVYAALLGRIMCGQSLTGSAISVGLGREVVRSWLVQGLADQASQADTYYSRFASDVYAATAQCAGDAEIQVHKRNPLEWLRTGPGRALYQDRENYWQPVDPQLPPPVSDLEPLNEVSAASPADEVLNARASAALDALRELNIVQNPEYARQITEQGGQLSPVGARTPAIVDSEHPASSEQVSPSSAAPAHPPNRG